MGQTREVAFNPALLEIQTTDYLRHKLQLQFPEMTAEAIELEVSRYLRDSLEGCAIQDAKAAGVIGQEVTRLFIAYSMKKMAEEGVENEGNSSHGPMSEDSGPHETAQVQRGD